MGCSCSSSAISQQQLDQTKNIIMSRSEVIIVDWSKAQYIAGIKGKTRCEGMTCLTNVKFYFLSNSIKIEQPLKTIIQITSTDSYKEKIKGDFTVFKLEKNQEFLMMFIENKEKLKQDCTSLANEKNKSQIEIEVL